MHNKYVRIASPKFLGIHKHKKICFTFFLFNFFLILTSAAAPDSQKKDVIIFLENLMIRECGLYTLLGSKPVTLFNITDTIDTSEEGLAQSYKELKKFFEKAEKDCAHYHTNGAILPDYEEYKKKCLKNCELDNFLHKKELWDSWLLSNPSISNPTYKLFSRHLSADTNVGLFINVPQALHILKKYHTEFSQMTGIEFDPEKILDSIEDESSIFWAKVLTNHYLLGLLLGYGDKNAYLFDWTQKNSFSVQSISILRFPELSRLNRDTKQTMKKIVTIKDLPIPYFVSFEINDKQIEHYTQEREKIINFLKDKELTTFVLSCLK